MELSEQLGQIDAFCENAARLIGGDITGARVRAVIEASNAGKYLFHGIKDSRSLEAIETEGILPKTPEGGPASYWATGHNLFGSSLASSSTWNTFDTPFFNYAHSRFGSQDKKYYMTMALTSETEIRKIKPSFGLKPDSVVTLNFPIPRSQITLLKAEGKSVADLQREMFIKIEEALHL